MCASACFIARFHPFAHVANGQTRAHFGERTCTPTPMIGVHPWEEKAGMSPRHPPMIPDVGPHHGVSCLPYPLATPAINVGPNEQKSDLRAGRGATDCALLNIAGRGDGGAWGSRFFLPSMDPILESSPHRPRRLMGPCEGQHATHRHTYTQRQTHTHTLSLSLTVIPPGHCQKNSGSSHESRLSNRQERWPGVSQTEAAAQLAHYKSHQRGKWEHYNR